MSQERLQAIFRPYASHPDFWEIILLVASVKDGMVQLAPDASRVREEVREAAQALSLNSPNAHRYLAMREFHPSDLLTRRDLEILIGLRLV